MSPILHNLAYFFRTIHSKCFFFTNLNYNLMFVQISLCVNKALKNNNIMHFHNFTPGAAVTSNNQYYISHIYTL